ncbi:FliM/FliN family flagellar motor switch protein [Pseudomonas sp. NPDC088444]|uniref:FliM/FliN family flagellar motor switch protein n=1 Tax=Pseudomonas sp. NPDC088444 TaxID=3364456 RepID=UPI00384CBFAD
MTQEALYDEELDTSINDEYHASPEPYEEDDAQALNAEDVPAHDDYAAEAPVLSNADAQALDSIDQLPMALTLRCGSLNLTLGDLRRIAPGTVLEVGGVRPGFATLCHGERVVAEGELVDIDGRLGLQITRVASPA